MPAKVWKKLHDIAYRKNITMIKLALETCHYSKF